jgi:hypothetical protein
MKDEKRLYIIGTVVYVMVLVTIYLISAGIPGAVPAPKSQPMVLGINLKLLGKACLSAFGPAFLIVLLINRYIWKWRWFRLIAGIRTPCVHGRWEGYLLSTYTNHKQQHEIAVEFWQTLQKIQIWYYDENAITRSLIADFVLDAEGGPMRIYCVYLNQPIRTHQPTLQYHQGVMDLYVDDEAREIHGTYYNNPHQRATHGEMRLSFVSRKLRKKFKYVSKVRA